MVCALDISTAGNAASKLGLGLATLAICAATASDAGRDTLEERRIDGRYLIQVHLSGGELRRFVFPEFPVEIRLPGSDGRTHTLRQPFELYAETRRYLDDRQIDEAYGDAYAALVANGDCLPIYASFREGSFDCGDRGGLRTVAVRTDALGAHLATETTASALIPDAGEFESAKRQLDELTDQVLAQAASADEAP